jgi:hypothetical protein
MSKMTMEALENHVMEALDDVREVRQDFKAKKLSAKDVIASTRNNTIVINAYSAKARHRDVDQNETPKVRRKA